MRGEVSGDLLLIGEVTEVRGTKVKVRVYSQANEASVFYHGELVRGVSVGGYLRLPCGYDDVIGIVEGDYQQESRAVASKGADGREAPGSYLERYVDVSVFGSFSSGRFNRGIGVLPLVRSKAYLLSPEQLAAVNSPVEATGAGFRVGELAGYGWGRREAAVQRAAREPHWNLWEHRLGQVEHAMSTFHRLFRAACRMREQQVRFHRL